MYLMVIVCWLVLTKHVRSECMPGFCSLDDDDEAFYLKENCNIPVDTLCSVQDHCNNDGQCFKDKVKDNVFCNCSESRHGNACQFSYSQFSPQCKESRDCNGGECSTSEGAGRWKCRCPIGFRGHKCEVETRVFIDNWVCENGGTAFVQGPNRGCLCPCGFTGTYCQHIAREAAWHQNCRDMICNGRGRCQVDEYYTAKCICKHNAIGKFCQFNSDLFSNEHTFKQYSVTTSDNICLNEGKLIYNSSEQTHSCTCPCGFHGPFCQYSILPQRHDYKNPCEEIPIECRNDRHCQNNLASCAKECKCGKGFCAKNCNTVCESNSGCDSFPCENGVCVGENCAESRLVNNEKTKNDTVKYIVIFSIGFLALMLLSVCSLFLYKRFKEKHISRSQNYRHDDTTMSVL